MSNSVPAPRPVHPCLLSVFDGNTGAEYSTWAHITTNKHELPNLVTAQGSTLRIYTVDSTSGKLALTHSFTNLAGSVCYLESLHVKEQGVGDSLLMGFAGHPRVAVVSVTAPKSLSPSPVILEATTLIDLTQALMEQSLGSITPLEQDLIAALEQKSSNVATLTIILGGGVAVASVCLQSVHGRNSNSGWSATEPYLLPLATLHQTLGTSNESTPAISHGMGDIISASFLSGYLEPTLVLLHANKEHGRGCSGRLGRPEGEGGTQYGMIVTAISLTVVHRRSAVLWSVEVPADALSLHAVGEQGVLVMSVNSILQVNNAGRIGPVLSVNGWVQTTCPTSLLEKLQPNPWPLPKLAVQLDGARLSILSEKVGILCLRQGQLYLLQHLGDTWSLMPLGTTLGAIGQISSLLLLPLADVPRVMISKLFDSNSTKKQLSMEMLSMGLLFAGSRLGDSSLLGYTLEADVTFTDKVKREGSLGKKQKIEEDTWDYPGTARPASEHEFILQREEDALYAPTEEDEGVELITEFPDVIPPSSDEEMEESTGIHGCRVAVKKRSRPRLAKLTVVRSVTSIDTLIALGPVGAGCEGPLSTACAADTESIITPNLSTPLGSTVRIFPCGYGSSGGLALVTVPGRDDRSILGEADCLNAQCIFSLPSHGLLLVGMAGSHTENGVSVLRTKLTAGPNEGIELLEVNLEEWCSQGEQDKKSKFVLESPLSIFRDNSLLQATDLEEDGFMVLVKGRDDCEPRYSVVLFAEVDGTLITKHDFSLLDNTDLSLGSMLSATPMVSHKQSGNNVVTFGCTWTSGKATVSTIGVSGLFETQTVECTEESHMIKTEHEIDDEKYYQSDKIHAVDVFLAPTNTFVSIEPSSSDPIAEKAQSEADLVVSAELEFDGEDAELYQDESSDAVLAEKAKTWKAADPDEKPSDNEDNLYVAVCRQSGLLQVFTLSADSSQGLSSSPVWESPGCGHGASILSSDISARRNPRMHQVYAREMRFFFSGPTQPISGDLEPTAFRSFNLIVENSNGDTSFYEKCKDSSSFARVPLHDVARPSKEESRHRTKLRRKGILGKSEVDPVSLFHFNRLHPFIGISGQDGLFAAISRPLWFMSERGSPVVLCHRARHVAPAGGNPFPVVGFCVGLKGENVNTERGFVTLHERIGRVGSQRLTIFRGMSNLLSPQGVFPGGGFGLEKISLGVTVRSIKFIDDSTISTGEHPLYAVLVSREIEADQSELNDDGLTPEERQQKKEEKDAEKVKRQVEADLGGFDLEQEWVEEIEREDCFEVDMYLGGSPPIQKREYALWIVDASNNWNVVDSHEFEEFEHCMTMEVFSLTEVNEEPGAITNTFEEENATNTLFISIGTGTVDKDGEDVSSKGRVLLFELKRQSGTSTTLGSPVADLSLVYEKDILHGAVTSLSCLTCGGRNRVVIGAGADINVEQWGNGRLTQVGFFRANMQILDIFLFKTFFLLSDAYDSLYFLVWRESDKSLTLLAKDYEPIPVYAAGIMSRGGSMTFLCHDDRQNLQFFQYSPGDPAARGGNKLVCRADVHLGSQTVGIQNYFCKSSLLVNSATPRSSLAALKQQDPLFGRSDDDQKLGVYFGTSDGGMHSVVPVSEPVFWRLTALQSVIANALESDCSLSHRAWRLYRRTPRRGGCRNNDRKKSVIDGDLVMQYADLPLPDQEDLASAIGSTVELVLDNLLELRCSNMII